MTYKIYRQKDSQCADEVIEILQEQSSSEQILEVIDVQQITLDSTEVKHILEMLGMWAVDLVQRDHLDWVDSHLNEESDDEEIITFIAQSPTVMKLPIVVKEETTALWCDFPDRVIELF
jgi:arsenate reductase-like glutaredoxin family protein